MPIGIDPKVDYAFKLIFGSPERTNITVHFLNAVLNFDDPITEVEILNPIKGKAYLDDKLSVLDILAIDSQGRRYNVEMQTTFPADLKRRLIYYNCQSYIQQLKSGQTYNYLRPAISICVLGSRHVCQRFGIPFEFPPSLRSAGAVGIQRRLAVSLAGVAQVQPARQ